MNLADIKLKVPMGEFLVDAGWDGQEFGHSWNGWISIKCPFHDDRSPSARYNDVKDRFDCYACDLHGDIFDVVQQVYGYVDVRDARAWIEARFLD